MYCVRVYVRKYTSIGDYDVLKQMFNKLPKLIKIRRVSKLARTMSSIEKGDIDILTRTIMPISNAAITSYKGLKDYSFTMNNIFLDNPTDKNSLITNYEIHQKNTKDTYTKFEEKNCIIRFCCKFVLLPLQFVV